MADCACHSPDAKDCLASREGRFLAFGDRYDAEECSCICHDEYYDDDDDGVSTELSERGAKSE